MSTRKKISVIVVNYNSTTKLNKLLKSLNKIEEYIYETIIVDNNSNDITKLISLNKKTTLFRNDYNYGFAKAVNQAIAYTKTQFILLLNPDCQIIAKTPVKTLELIENNTNIFIAGGRILDTKSKVTYTATGEPNFFTGLFEFTNLKKILPNNHFSKKFWIENNKINKPTIVFSLCGAYLFINKNHLANDKLFDETYFLYLEDLDIGFKAKKNHLKIVFDPNSRVIHYGGGSNKSYYKIVLKFWYKSRKIFFLKNLPKYQGLLLYIIFVIEEFILKIYHYINNSPNE